MFECEAGWSLGENNVCSQISYISCLLVLLGSQPFLPTAFAKGRERRRFRTSVYADQTELERVGQLGEDMSVKRTC